MIDSPHNSASLDATIRGRWPTPLALSWGSVVVAEGARERLKRLIAFTEILFRVTAVVGLADYRSSDEIAPGNVKDHSHVECLLAGKIFRNFTLGDWHKLACGLTRGCVVRERGPFLREFAEWLDKPHAEHDSNERALGWLVKLRNDNGHGGEPESATAIERSAIQYEEFIRGLLVEMDWWSGYRFVHVRSASAASASGSFRGTLDVWAGNRSPVHRLMALWRGWLVPGEMYVFSPDGSRALRVSRLARILSTHDNPTDRFFLFHHGIKRGGVLLMDDRTTDTDSDIVPVVKGGRGPAFAWLPRADQAHVALIDVEGKLASAADVDADASRFVDQKYALHEVLGRGGSSTVYRATNTALSLDCAVKVLSHSYCADAVARERFVREARLMHQMSNRHVQRALDFGQLPDGRPYIATPIAEGGSLADVIAAGPVENERVWRWLAQALEGLTTLHTIGITHRDIKPANLLLQSGQVCITDLGVASSIEHSALTTHGALIGTLAYMSPEQLRGGAATSASDIYALGVVGHELLTGARPAEHIGQGIPGRLGALIRCMAQLEPGHRPSALQAAQALSGPYASTSGALPSTAPASGSSTAVAPAAGHQAPAQPRAEVPPSPQPRAEVPPSPAQRPNNALETIGPGSRSGSSPRWEPYVPQQVRAHPASVAQSAGAANRPSQGHAGTLGTAPSPYPPGAKSAEKRPNNVWVWAVLIVLSVLVPMCGAVVLSAS